MRILLQGTSGGFGEERQGLGINSCAMLERVSGLCHVSPSSVNFKKIIFFEWLVKTADYDCGC